MRTPYTTNVSQPSSSNLLCPLPELSEWTNRKKHILIVEDNPLLQHFHSMWLEDLDYNVTVVDSGEDALRTHLPNYDAVLMDLDLPGDDGITTTQKLLKKIKLPIIACTSHSESEMKEKCITAGMVDYLQKPISPARLAHALTTHLI